MKFKELISSVNYKTVYNVIYKDYYHGKGYSNSELMDIDSAYLTAFKTLLAKEPSSPEDNYKISLKTVDDEGDPYIDCFLYDEDSDQSFAMDFSNWSDLLSFEIYNPLNFTDAEIAAHLLWEMTFWGFTESEIEKQKQITLESEEDFSEISLDELV